jgi:hypothetical protein
VNLATEKATIEFDRNLIKTDEIINAIVKLRIRRRKKQ